MRSFYTYSLQLLILASLTNGASYAQCVFGSQYLEQEDNNSTPATDVQDGALPANLLTNLRYISGFFFLAPEYRVYTDGTTSGAKTYCSCQQQGCNTSTIFVGKRLITEYANNNAYQDGLWGLVAHEVAHAYQCNLGITPNLTGVQCELHADFLAGYYLGRKTHFTLTNIKQFADELYRRGDFKFNDPQHHGTPEERVRMMLIGASVNILTLDDASRYGYRLVTGQSNYYNILGNWAPNQNLLSGSPVRVNIFTGGNAMAFQQFNLYNGQVISAATMATGMGGNQYRILWPATPQYPQGLIQDFFVIDDNKIIVMLNTGVVDIWLRM